MDNGRRATRVPLRATVTGYLLALPGHPSILLHTRNISTGGLGFVSRRPFKTGEVIAIDLAVVPNMAKVILAETTFARYVRDGLHENGCKFREAVSRADFAARYPAGTFPPAWVELARAGSTP